MEESLPKNQAKPKSIQQLKNDVTKNRKILDDLCNVNETLKQTLKQLKLNVKQTIRPDYQKLENERLALEKLLYFDENHSLKQNFTIFFNQKSDEKQRLLNYLECLKRMNQDLFKKSISYKSQINQSKKIEECMKFEKNELINQLYNLQQERFKKMSVKLQKQRQNGFNFQEEEQQVGQNLNFSRIKKQTSLEKYNANQYSDQGNQSSSSQLESSIISKQTSIIYHQESIQQVFASDLDSKEHPKSKQILNSLQKQLNPLRINEHIEYLERQIEQIKSQRLKILEQQMKKQIGLNKKLKENYRDTNNKLEMMKKNVGKFKLQRFGTDKL